MEGVSGWREDAAQSQHAQWIGGCMDHLMRLALMALAGYSCVLGAVDSKDKGDGDL
jgi:hypothetical protein